MSGQHQERVNIQYERQRMYSLPFYGDLNQQSVTHSNVTLSIIKGQIMWVPDFWKYTSRNPNTEAGIRSSFLFNVFQYNFALYFLLSISAKQQAIYG